MTLIEIFIGVVVVSAYYSLFASKKADWDPYEVDKWKKRRALALKKAPMKAFKAREKEALWKERGGDAPKKIKRYDENKFKSYRG